ncbi:MAG: polyprenyl synthetase family protein [Fimbriimonas ginsengisoli]|uniref:Polyprenyl synthetase family protein n=1 Tax=Fimbriimonas ginsengisoli TaxID=1005039 RepID=A0A931LQK2_FIMGI|nr:polyprenyl synthetase family protein [Fimbriimonas ginsengisoli]
MVDARLAELLPPASQSPTELHEAMRYSCLAPGKRLRPVLCMGAAIVAGAPAESLLDAGCALELVHCFSLIHDDLPAIDDDDLRRGAPTCHRQFGEAVAILAGDALFALAYRTLSGSPHSSDRLVQALAILSAAAGTHGLVGGEMLDILAERRPVDAAQLRNIHGKKTGALIAASCEIGGLLAGAEPALVGALRAYGEHAGLAFQIADDILNELSTPEQLGKAAGSDRRRGKATYPGLFGIDASREAAQAASEAAIAALEGVPRTGLLIEMARYAVERGY